MVVVHVVTSLPSDSSRVMRLVREFMLRSLHYNILVLARHVLGLDNSIAGALSCLQMRDLAGNALRPDMSTLRMIF